MNSSRGPFLSGIVLGVGIGLLLSHFFVTKERRFSRNVSNFEVPLLSSGSASFPEGLFSTAELGGGTSLDFAPEEVEEIRDDHPLKNALALDSSPSPLQKTTSELAPIPPTTGLSEPAPIAISDASPISTHSEEEYRTIRAIIDLELSHLPQDKREVWFEALKDVGKEDVTGILRMWKLLGGPSPGTPVKETLPDVPAAPVRVPKGPDLVQNGIAQTGKGFSALLNQAAEMLQENELMQNNPEYVTRIPILHEDEAGNWSIKTHWKHFSDRRVQTGFPLDLAISGTGFFQVADEAGKKYLTRYGHFVLDETARVCLQVGDERFSLVPEVRFPDDFESSLSSDEELQQKTIVIDEQGGISIRAIRNGEKVVHTQLGQIELFLPLSSDDIVWEGNGLWALRNERQSGLVSVHFDPAFGTSILSGSLELPAKGDDSLPALLKKQLNDAE
jgi:flagellar basal body rod protein FlgG